MNKATGPPPGLAIDTDVLQSAPSRTNRNKGPRTAREGLTRRPALPTCNAWCRLHADKGTLRKRHQHRRTDAFWDYHWGFPASRGEMLSGGRYATSMPFGWMAVTQGPSRNRSAPPPVMPVGRSSRLDSHVGRRWNSVTSAGSREAASCMFRHARSHDLRRGRFQRLPEAAEGHTHNEHIGKAAGRNQGALGLIVRDARAVTERCGAATPLLRTSRFSAEARDASKASPKQEAGAACRILCTPPRCAKAQCSDGCRKQPALPAGRAHSVGRGEARPTSGLSP